MRLLFLGDIVGPPGVGAVRKMVPGLRESERLDAVVVNAENAAGGSGLTPGIHKQLRAAKVDAVTLGDHIYRKYDIVHVLANLDESIVKPANFPASAPGRDHCIFAAADGTRVAVISLLGRTFMKPVDCPFLAADRVLEGIAGKADAVIVDFHAEATGEKYSLAHYLAGRVAAVFGTHTHVPTADEQILPGGTAFICDVGMTGPYAGILGRRADRVVSATVTMVPCPFDVATEDVRLSGAIVEIDRSTGRAQTIRRVMWRHGG